MPQSRVSVVLKAVSHAVLLGGCAVTIAGCGMQTSSTAARIGTDPLRSSVANLGGNVRGGQQPIAGAMAQLWAAGVTGASPAGYGANATLLAATTTDANGGFSFDIGGNSPCTAGQHLYITSVGGDSGSGSNSLIALMAAIPTPCGSTTASSFVIVNEVTTAASVAALQQFMKVSPTGLPAWQIGAPASNAIGLANAFLQVGNLVDTAGGVSSVHTVTNTIGSVAYTTTITPDVPKINTFANILAACVNSTGTTTCGSLFADTTANGQPAPTDTLQAAYYMATTSGVGMPTHGNPSGLSPPWLCANYVVAVPPFPSSIACNTAVNTTNIARVTFPTDWAIGVSLSATNVPGSGAAAVAVINPDKTISLNVTSGGSGYTAPPAVLVIGGTGTTAYGTFTAVLGTGATAGQVVSFTPTSSGAGYTVAPQTVFLQTTVGTSQTAGVALDGAGNIWTAADTGLATNGSVVEFDPTGRVIMTPVNGYTLAGGWDYSALCPSGCSTTYPLAGGHTSDTIAIDTDGNAWSTTYAQALLTVSGNPDTFGNGACKGGIDEGTVVKITNHVGTGTAQGYLVGQNAGPLAIDASNNVFTAGSVTNGPSAPGNVTSGTLPNICALGYYPSELQAAGSPAYTNFTQGTSGTPAPLNSYGFSIAIDPIVNQNVYFFGSVGQGTIPYINHSGSSGLVGSTTPLVVGQSPSGSLNFGVVDATGNIWASAAGTNSGILYYIDIANSIVSPTYTTIGEGSNSTSLGGMRGPRGMAFDGGGHLWVVNAPAGLSGAPAMGGGLSEFTPGGNGATTNGKTLTPLSPAAPFVAGFANNYTWDEPIGPVIDPSGNVWIKTLNGVQLNYVVGVAVPIITPIAQSIRTATALNITSVSVPNGVQTLAYGPTQLAAVNGTGALAWSVSAGSTLPAGLALSNSGLLTGTPTASGTYAFTVQATDSSVTPQTATQSYTMSIFAFGGNIGGQYPMAGASVKLWAAGTTGSVYGANATLLATATTDSNGTYGFGTGSTPPCAPGQLLYITATGGSSANAGSNSSAALMAALPTPCSSSTGPLVAAVNEVTTAASIAALQQFMTITPGSSPGWQIGAPTTNLTGLANAFLQVGNLVNTVTGVSGVSTVSNKIGSVTYTTTITPDVSKINTFADVLAACVNTAGGTTCSNLLADTTPSGSPAPVDTIQAAYYMATTSGVGMPIHGNPSGLSAPWLCTTYAGATPPFPATACNTGVNANSNTQVTYPTDWAIGVTWQASNGSTTVGTSQTSGVALDAAGNIWTAAQNNLSNGGSVVEFNPSGQVIMAPVTNYTLAGGWDYSLYCPGGAGCGSTVPLGGTRAADSLAIDTNGNAWTTTAAGSQYTVTRNPDTFGSGACAAGLYEGTSVKITNNSGTGSALGYLVGQTPSSLAIDGSNNVFSIGSVTAGPPNAANNTTGVLPNNCETGYYVSELAASGSTAYSTFSSGSASTAGNLANLGGSVAIDQTANQNVYAFGVVGQGTIPYINHNGGSGLVGSATPIPLGQSPQGSFSYGVADARGNLWVSAAGTSSGILYYVDISSSIASPNYTIITESSNGTTYGGLRGPRGLAIDGAGHLWIVNAPNGLSGPTVVGGGLSEFVVGSIGGTVSLSALSPAGTYVAGFDNNYTWVEPVGPVIDSSGNVWIKTVNGNVLNYVVGIAVPVMTPIAQRIQNSTSLTIATDFVASGVQTVAYSGSQFAAQNGTGALTWSVAPGSSLPAGLALSNSGALTGVPTVSGNFTFGIQVTDSASPQHMASQTYTMTIYALNTQSLGTAVASLPSVTVGQQVKNVVLKWALANSTNYANAGDTTNANALLNDVATELNVVFTPPDNTRLPAAYFPPIPGTPATNPILAGAVSLVAGQAGYNPPFHQCYENNAVAQSDTIAAEEALRAFLYPGTSNTFNPALINSLLNRAESTFWTRGGLKADGVTPGGLTPCTVNTSSVPGGQWEGDFTAAGDQPYFYLMLLNGWSQLMLPSRAAAWKARLDQDAAFLLDTAHNPGGPGLHFSKVPNDVATNWINADIRWWEDIAYDSVIKNQVDGTSTPAAITSILNGVLGEMQQSLLPDGGSDYTDQQNENPTYHGLFPADMARYGRVMNNAQAVTIAANTLNYNLLQVTSPVPAAGATASSFGFSEYITTNSWHKYWDQVTDTAGAVVPFGLVDDLGGPLKPYLPYVLWQIQRDGWPTSYDLAQYYRSDVTPAAIPANFMAYDENIEGPRGQQGPFTVVGTTRPTPLSYRGKATFVGTMMLTPYTNATAPLSPADYPLDSAVEAIGVQIVNTPCPYPTNFVTGATSTPGNTGDDCSELNNPAHIGAMDGNNIMLADNEFDAQTTTSTFGAVSSVHSIAGYGEYNGSTPSPWQVAESWLLLPTRVIGLVQFQAVVDSTNIYRLQGDVRFVSGYNYTNHSVVTDYGSVKSLLNPSPNVWTFGNTTLQIYQNTFGGNVTQQVDNTFQDTGLQAVWLRLEDGATSNTVSRSVSKGTSYYYLADVRPGTGVAAANVSSNVTTNGLISFQLTDSGTQYTVVFNPTADPLPYTAPLGATAVPSGTEYRPSFLLPDASYTPPAAFAGSVPPYSHVVFHN